MKKTFLFFSLMFANELANPTRLFFSQGINTQSPSIQQCVAIFIELAKSSDYGFKQWSNDKEDEEYVKDHTSFLIDQWRNDKITAKLFFDWKDPQDGSGLMTWLEYNPTTGELKNVISKEKLEYNEDIEKKTTNLHY
ncbi:hypothetical protein CQA57_03680 [Helicobacter anseris]|uniref:Uncharacterized protein n=1 Tax=Helicobacter anseris TaxID=375926 RepID=A0A3D8J9T0_9HELI|nr:hypothetical protein [Helicobacter anseris]RDU73925.1 hypothetical protein CQA57_03680 [Helicobacter anseris]